MPDDDQPQPGAARITGMKEVAPDLLAARPSRDWSFKALTTATGSGSALDRRPHRDLCEVAREIRPDWDLATPGPRETGRPAATRCIIRIRP